METKMEESLALLETWKPNIVALSYYIWNKFLSAFMCSYAKKIKLEIFFSSFDKVFL